MKNFGLYGYKVVDEYLIKAQEQGAEIYANDENASLLDGDFLVILNGSYTVITEEFVNCWSSAYRVKRYYGKLPIKWQKHFELA